MKKILILIIIALSLQSCTKDKSEYYINQPRDPDLVGVWVSTRNESFSYRKFTIDGKMYTRTKNTYNHNIGEEVDWLSSYYYWYSNNKYVYTYDYHGAWVDDSKLEYVYRFSEDKKQMWLGSTNTIEQPLYERVENL